MQRDGFTQSLWQHNMTSPGLSEPKSPAGVFDVLIIGAGITGITTGLLLQKAGKRCIVIDSEELGFGTTGGTTAHLNTLLDTTYADISKDFGEENARLVAQGAREALDLIKANVTTLGIDCGYSEQPGFLFSQTPDQTKELDKIAEAAQKAGLDVADSDRIPVPLPFEKAIVVQGQAQFHPILYLYALAKAYQQAGGLLLEHCRFTESKQDNVIEVSTSLGLFQTRNLIYATHIPPGVNLLSLRCAPYRSYAVAAKLSGDQYPAGLCYDLYEPYHYFRTQEMEGEKFLIVGGEDHKTGHQENTETCFLQLEAYVKKYYPVEKFAFRWSSQLFEPADGLPYIGRMPASGDHVFVASGFSGNGLTYGTLSAIVLTAQITEGSSPYEKLFSPSRIKPIAGFVNFVKENADVAKEFVTGRFHASAIKEVSELARGEGRLVKYEGQRIGLYRDDNGALHAVDPVCTHAKCIVSWNTAERSWDCPCHGGRFTPEGKLITGPPAHDLQKIDLEQLETEK